MLKKKNIKPLEVVSNIGKNNGRVIIMRKNDKELIVFEQCSEKDYKKHKRQAFIRQYIFPILIGLVIFMLLFLLFCICIVSIIYLLNL